jgi:hypothetical protein
VQKKHTTLAEVLWYKEEILKITIYSNRGYIKISLVGHYYLKNLACAKLIQTRDIF